MTDGKSAVTSFGVMGPVLAVLVVLVNNFFFKSEVVTATDLSSIVDVVSMVVGLVTGVIGRIKATKQITTIV